MIIFNDVEQNTDAWLDLRKGKITGSKLNGVITKRGNGKKIGFYELLAERIAIPKDGEDAMERGSRLEDEAIEELEKEFGVIERIGFCTREDNENIAISMDGYQSKNKRAFEVKCLGSAKHLMSYFEQKIPNEYKDQAMQYFVVDEGLKELVFAFYDPRVVAKPLHHITIKREDIEDEIKILYGYQVDILKEIDEMAEEIAF